MREGESAFEKKNRTACHFVTHIVRHAIGRNEKGYHKDVYSEHYVPVEEVQDELSFSIYKEMDWEQILLQKQEYLTKKAASEILEFLGLKDYIQLPEKSENAALDRGEWNAVYTEILAYLDDEKTVTTQDLLLMDVIESDSGCILVTNEGDYPSKFGQHFLTAWDNYRLYLLDGKCVGIAGISGEEAEVYNTYIKAVEDGTLTFYPVVQNMRLQWMHRKKM